MYKQGYGDKINSFLEDTNTYEISNQSIINKKTLPASKSFQKLTKSKKKNLDTPHRTPPNNPTLYGLPKTHKPDTTYDQLFPASVALPTKKLGS